MPDRPAPGGEVEASRRRILLWVGGLLVAAVLAALVAALALVNGETAKAAIERQLAALTGTEIRYGTLTLRAWPRPEAESPMWRCASRRTSTPSRRVSCCNSRCCRC